MSDENLQAAERAQLERERNREHARNTRIRKKEMLATLQDTAVTLQQRLACFDLQRAADDVQTDIGVFPKKTKNKKKNRKNKNARKKEKY